MFSLFLLVAAQESLPVPDVAIDPAVESLTAFANQLHAEESLHFSLNTEFALELREGEGLQVLSKSSIEGKLLKPMQGWVRIRGGSTLAGSQDKIDVTFVGDGERFWLLDHVRKQRIKTGRGFENLEMFLPHFLPLDFWLEGAVPSWDANSVRFVSPDESFRGLKGLSLTEDKGWKTLWFDSKGNVKAFTWRTDPKQGRRIEVAMTGLHLNQPEETPAEEYVIEIPGDYRLIDLEARAANNFEASLLPIGPPVPAVEFNAQEAILQAS
ncbi:MAG TPA: hypothetical protein DDW23_03810 [Planctomycetes bacterium]|nr:hypothetical protein [Planctomycetota bacterium]